MDCLGLTQRQVQVPRDAYLEVKLAPLLLGGSVKLVSDGRRSQVPGVLPALLCPVLHDWILVPR